MASAPEFVVLGAGVAGLTTATELRQQFPSARISVVAKYLPGFTSPTEYTSPWAGADWQSFEPEYNRVAAYDAVGYKKFLEIAAQSPESGVKSIPLRGVYDDAEMAVAERKIWYRDLVGGFKEVPKEELPAGAAVGLDWGSLIINTVHYLFWLQSKLAKTDVKFMRRSYTHIDHLAQDFPDAVAIFNCTGIGARHLGGVEDHNVYPTKGVTLLISEPKVPLKRISVRWSSKWPKGEFAHVFPRPLGGGVIIGGVRRDHDWTAEPDMQLAERIKQRACELEPELGRPEDLKVVSYNVGLRPSREGGSRVELEHRRGKLLVHNYGASGGGYQASWGMAGHAVDLLKKELAASKSKL